MARPCYGVFIVFLLKLGLGECAESSEETASTEVLGDEYAQIFHYIPTLFEYILEILKDRPEILEKDDLTFFQETPQEACEEDKRDIKREVYETCDNNVALNKDHHKAFKRNIAANYFSNVKHTNIYNEDHSVSKITKEIPERKLRDNRNGNNDKVASNVETKLNKNVKNKSKTGARYKQGTKRNTFDESFIGSIDWSKFYLSPEEVEEQTLQVEEALEKHNSKER